MISWACNVCSGHTYPGGCFVILCSLLFSFLFLFLMSSNLQKKKKTHFLPTNMNFIFRYLALDPFSVWLCPLHHIFTFFYIRRYLNIHDWIIWIFWLAFYILILDIIDTNFFTKFPSKTELYLKYYFLHLLSNTRIWFYLKVRCPKQY